MNWIRSIIRKIMGKPQNLSFSSTYPVDQTMLSFSFDVIIPGDGASHNYVIFGLGDNLLTDCLWVGRFSTDNISWTPMDGIILSGGNYIAASGDTRNGFFEFTSVNKTGVSITLHVEITLIAKKNQAPFTPPAPGAVPGTFGGPTNLVFNNNPKYPLFDSRLNYMKIAKQDILPLTVPNDGSYVTLTIPHNLGYVPFALIQMESVNPFNPTDVNQFTMSNLTNATEVNGLLAVPALSYIYMDTSNITLKVGGVTAASPFTTYIHYRYYYDN